MKIFVLGGAGHIGFPMSLMLAHGGHEVCICDPSQMVRTIKKRESPYQENGIERFLENDELWNRLSFSPNLEDLEADFDCAVVTIGTPVDEWGNPNTYALTQTVSDCKNKLVSTGLIMLRSTITPGLTDLMRKSLGCSISFCPERVTQGNSLDEIKALPQVIGAATDDEISLSKQVLAGVCDEFIVTSTRDAELTKLMSNYYRYAHFAIANQIYMLSKSLDGDPETIFHAMKHNYPRAKSIPTPGYTAGPCLYKDTIQLNSVSNSTFLLGLPTVMVNEGLVSFVINEVMEKWQPKRVALLGAAFKRECDDFRDSLTFKFRKLLFLQGVEDVGVFDPYVEHPFVIRDCDPKIITEYDCAIVTTPHGIFEEMKPELGDMPVFDIHF